MNSLPATVNSNVVVYRINITHSDLFTRLVSLFVVLLSMLIYVLFTHTFCKSNYKCYLYHICLWESNWKKNFVTNMDFIGNQKNILLSIWMRFQKNKIIK